MINVDTYLSIVSRRGLFHTLFPAPRFQRARTVTRQQEGFHSPRTQWTKLRKWKKKTFRGFEGFDVEWYIQSNIKCIPGQGDEKF